MLPRMAISGDRIFVHYTAISAERYLLSLIFTIIDGHPSQAVGLIDESRTLVHIETTCQEV